MTPTPATPVNGLLATLDLLALERHGAVLHLRLNRPAKRNALSDPLIHQLHNLFVNLPEGTRAVLLSAEGDHFCAGLDLSELIERDVHSAVVAGGLELAASCHLRVAEHSAYYGLPEGQRGIFVGGGGSARIPRLMGVAHMTDLMLSGRVLDAHEGQQVGLAQYLVPDGEGPAKAMAMALALAQRIAQHAPMSNFAVMQALPRIADQSQSEGLFTEALMAALAESTPEAQDRLRAFLDKRAGKVVKG